MSIFEGIGNLDNRARPRDNSGFLLSRKQNSVLYFDLRTSAFVLRLSWWDLAVVSVVQELPRLIVTWGYSAEGQSGLVGS